MTRQAVHQLVGPGVSDGMRVAVVCVDGVRSMVTQRDGSEPRCPRCKAHLKRINYRWSGDRVNRSHRRTHRQRGDPVDDANVDITPAGRGESRICVIRLERHRAKLQKRREFRCKIATRIFQASNKVVSSGPSQTSKFRNDQYIGSVRF